MKQATHAILDPSGSFQVAPNGKELRAASKLRKLLQVIDASVDFAERPDLGSLVNWSSRVDAPLHRWLRYREAYNPQLINKLNLTGSILDPFCGCGSTLIGAALNEQSAFGIDVNPLAAFATRVKLSPLSGLELHQAKLFLERLPRDLDKAIPSPIPALEIAPKVFEPSILECIQKIHAIIQDLQVFELLCLGWLIGALSAALKDVRIEPRRLQRAGGKPVMTAQLGNFQIALYYQAGLATHSAHWIWRHSNQRFRAIPDLLISATNGDFTRWFVIDAKNRSLSAESEVAYKLLGYKENLRYAPFCGFGIFPALDGPASIKILESEEDRAILLRVWLGRGERIAGRIVQACTRAVASSAPA
jgi:hypothetical protein